MKRVLLVILLFTTMAAFGDGVLTHEYLLTTGSTADTQGTGPALTLQGGTLTSSGYTFAAGQGISLTGALNPTNYSVEMVFTMTDVNGYRKLLDFSNLTSDNGLYEFSGTNPGFMWYEPLTGSGPGAMGPAGTVEDMIVTRDGTTNLFSVYVNNEFVFSFVDSRGYAVLPANNTLWFMQYRNPYQSGGTITRIRTFEGALNYDQVLFWDLYNGEGPGDASQVPEPASMLLLGTGLLGLAGIMRRKIR